MWSYNRVNGKFACEDSYLLTDVLKKDFNFKGLRCLRFVEAHCGELRSLCRRLIPESAVATNGLVLESDVLDELQKSRNVTYPRELQYTYIQIWGITSVQPVDLTRDTSRFLRLSASSVQACTATALV